MLPRPRPAASSASQEDCLSLPSPPATVPSRPFAYTGGQLTADGVPLATLAERFGTPLYLNSATHIRHRFHLFTQAFRSIPHTICYAVKANSALAILRLLAAEGAGFDIVSGGELERVRRAAPDALPRVVFSGAGKQAWELDAALGSNIALFNVESPAELELLAARATALGRTAPFALRVNPDVLAETHPYISTGLREHKFGIEIAQAPALYRHAARAHPTLRATGVSVHIGSQIRSVSPFAQAIRRVAALIHDLRAEGHAITALDAGGGLGIDYDAPLESAASPSEPTPEGQVALYAEALLPILRDLGCDLLLEPGRFLVAQSGGLLTRVLSRKQNGAKHFLITDAAMNDLIRPALYQAHHEIVPVRQPAAPENGVLKPVDIVGPVCESGDFFAHDRPMPSVAAGDLLLILDAGAYGMSQSSNYNTRGRPPELLLDAGTSHLIRRRETLDDLLATEILA